MALGGLRPQGMRAHGRTFFSCFVHMFISFVLSLRFIHSLIHIVLFTLRSHIIIIACVRKLLTNNNIVLSTLVLLFSSIIIVTARELLEERTTGRER